MSVETRNTDSKGRLVLPQSFANATVIVERISDSELRIRKAKVVPEDEYRFEEEFRVPLSDRDRDIFLAMLENPPPANAAFRRAAAKYKRRHDRLAD
jgi:hypothetical protein